MREKGDKTDLRGMDLQNAKFRDVNLIEVDLMRGNFSYSDFSF